MAGSVVSAQLTMQASGSSTPALPSSLQCVKALVKETIGQPYAVTLDLLTDATGLDPAKVMGQAFEATYTWQDAMTGGSGLRRWSGVAVSLVFLGSVADTTTPLHYRVVLQPPLALAQRTIRTRALVAAAGSFCTIHDVLTGLQPTLLAGADLSHVDPTYPWPPFPFFTQYAESDLHFLSRLVETYGISFFWSADTQDSAGKGAAAKLWFTADNNGFQPVNPVPPGAKTPDCLPVNANAGPASSIRAVYRAAMRFGLMPAEAQAIAWNPPRAAGGTDGAPQTGSWAMAKSTAMKPFGLYPVDGSLAEFRQEPIVSPDTNWPSTSNVTTHGTWPEMMAAIRMAQAAIPHAKLAATSNLEALFAGCAIRFDAGAEALSVVPNFTPDGYVIESITHQVLAPGSHLVVPSRRNKPDARTLYRNSFRAVPVQISGAQAASGFTYCPPRRAKPRVVATLQHATLQATDAKQVFPDLDPQGRYLVVPDYPLEPVSGTGTPPAGLRVPKIEGFSLGSLAAGSNARQPAGLHMPLRPGQSVLLGFVNGDPDQPFIAGVLPNAYQPSPVTNAVASLPYQSVLRTASGLTVRITDSL